MNAQRSLQDLSPQVVPMTATAVRMLDENGFFGYDDNRHELVNGVLLMTSPPGTGHFYVEGRANRALNRALMTSGLFETHFVQTGGAFRIDDHTLLGPDMMIVPVPSIPGEVTSESIIALIEISGSSRTNDLGPKAKIYAHAGIADYWVLDVAAKSVIVHRNPVDGAYTSVQSFKAPSSLTCALLPDLTVQIMDLF